MIHSNFGMATDICMHTYFNVNPISGTVIIDKKVWLLLLTKNALQTLIFQNLRVGKRS